MKRIIMACAAVAMLSGCAASGVQVTEQQVQAFQKGKTTYPEVVARLGQPNANSIDSKGTRTIAYIYSEASTRPESFIPYIGGFIGGVDMRSNVVTFMFDKNGVLQEYAASSSQTGTGFNLSAGQTKGRVEAQPRQAK